MPAKQELSAGGIVFRKGSNGPEILLIKDHKGKWTFPKGHVEEGEEPRSAAQRETREETGLPALTVRDVLGKTEYWFKDKWSGSNETVHKTVRYFLLEAPPDADPSPPQDWTEGVEPIADAKWFSPEEARKLSGYKDNAKLLARALEVLTRPKQDSLIK